MTHSNLPLKQQAIQLVGPGVLKRNPSKAVHAPGPRQVLAKVEAVGLCFSDLKLLKQFSQHARKGGIISGIDPAVLGEIPSYVPGDSPTVPGHEAVCRIVAIGEGVRHHRLGERCLVQTDYRALRTPNSNASFGYNFEGALQEYVLMDERIVLDPESGERFLIPAPEGLSASAVALVEPWACVEESYACQERTGIKAGGRLLVVVEEGFRIRGLREAVLAARPTSILALGGNPAELGELAPPGLTVERLSDLASLPAECCDDIVCFGACRGTIESLNDKLAARGLVNIVTAGRRIGEPVSVGIGRVHYGMTRWVGTASESAADAYDIIPPTGEIRPGDRIVIVGAAGPMGQMHVIRDLCQGVPGVTIVGADMDDTRLEALAAKARPLAEAHRVPLDLVNTSRDPLTLGFSYYALLAPVGRLVADAITNSLDGCIINIFAGIPAPTRQELDLDTYIANHCYMIGTSGSVIRDMKVVLEKVESGRLDTNISVDAVSGMAGAEEGLAAVENRTLAGKIIVYPSLSEVGLIPLAEMHRHFPSVSAKLERGQWTKAAEKEFLRVASRE